MFDMSNHWLYPCPGLEELTGFLFFMIRVPDEQDGDDSDPNYGPMDSFGNLTAISQPYQFTEYEITATEVWSSDLLECGNIIVIFWKLNNKYWGRYSTRRNK
jgi:hypothetical protein